MKIDASIMSREVYFPTLVYSFQHAEPEALNTRLLELIYGDQERDQEGIQRSNFRALGGWHSHNDLHKNPEYSEERGRPRPRRARR